ncbi:MAG: ABC transporter permease [Clostridia bacterium]|nr:ABC transporter permease [Clostridia bacterium]
MLAAALLINFFLPRALPGNPLDQLSGGAGAVVVAPDEVTRAALEAYYGLDRPLGEQLLHYLAGLARGDLGFSISYKAPVADLLRSRLPWTLLLGFAAAFLSCFPAVVLGTRAGLGRVREGRVLVPAAVLESVPPFVLGSFLLLLLGVKLRLFPISGAYSTFATLSGWEKVADVARHAVLPVLALAASGFFDAYLVVRNSVRLVKDEPYVLLARVKGLPERYVNYRYILRPALLPVVTLFSMRAAFALGGAVLVEVLFAYPGVGRLVYEAVLSHDYPLLQGTFFLFTLWVLAINFATDLLYLKLDPRIREV